MIAKFNFSMEESQCKQSDKREREVPPQEVQEAIFKNKANLKKL